MISEENKEQIKTISKEHFKSFDVLKIEDADLGQKVQLVFNELPNLYRKLKEAEVLPEKVDLNVFMQIVTPRLEEAAQSAYVMKMFGI